MKLIIILLLAFSLIGCRSIDNSGNPINRSLLIDSGFDLGLDIPIIPIPLPKIKLGFKLHFRRPTPREEIELNLSKLGRQLEEHNQVPKDKLEFSPPVPFSVHGEQEKDKTDEEIRMD